MFHRSLFGVTMALIVSYLGPLSIVIINGPATYTDRICA